MVTRYRVQLNDKQLDDVSTKLIILDINEQNPSVGVSTMTNAGYDGNRVLRQYRQNLQVTVSFNIEQYDIVKRKKIATNVQKWAINGGKLRLNDREGQYLNVICTQLPTVTSALKWLDVLQVVFTAYDVPYWQSDDHATVSIVANTPSVTTKEVAKSDGNAGKCYIDCVVKNTDKTALTNLTVKAGTSSIKLSGISIKPNESVTFEYDDNMMLSIKKDQTSLLKNRTASSSDDLSCVSGKNTTFSVNANVKCLATFTMKGMFL